MNPHGAKPINTLPPDGDKSEAEIQELLNRINVLVDESKSPHQTGVSGTAAPMASAMTQKKRAPRNRTDKKTTPQLKKASSSQKPREISGKQGQTTLKLKPSSSNFYFPPVTVQDEKYQNKSNYHSSRSNPFLRN